MPAHTYKGNNTGSTANPADITSTQLTADLNQFTSLLQGMAPASGGGTTNYLRADGSWAAPAGVGTVTSIGVSVPAFLSVTPSTITSNGTFAISLSGTALPIANGGTGQTTAAAAFNALNPMTTTGDILYESATNVASRLAVGTTGQVLTVVAGVPAWANAGSSNYRAGTTSLSSGVSTVTVTFSSALGSTPSVTATLLNTTDTSVQYEPVTITAVSTTAFTVKFNGPTGTANYSLSWIAMINN